MGEEVLLTLIDEELLLTLIDPEVEEVGTKVKGEDREDR